MVQNPKGGGLSSSFGGQGTQNIGGVQNTTTFLDRTTWTLAIALFALILLSNFAIPREGSVETKSQVEGITNDREISDEIPTLNEAQSEESSQKDSAK